MNIYVSEVGGEFQVSFTGLETVEEVQAALWEGEQLMHFLQFGENMRGVLEDAVRVIDALTCLDPTREVLEKLLTAVYRLGTWSVE